MQTYKMPTNIEVHTGWQGIVTLDVSKEDRFAIEAIEAFGFKTEDLGYCIRIPVISAKQAREFVSYCE